MANTYSVDRQSKVEFSGLRLTKAGRTSFVFECRTSPPSDYGFQSKSKIFQIVRPNLEQPGREAAQTVQLKFLEDFSLVLGMEDSFIAAVDNYMTQTFPGVRCDNYTIWQGILEF